MNELARFMEERIRQGGPMTLAEYMQDCLAHPRLGYYTTRMPFGESGDFTTAPEVSQMFGELLGLWCVVSWRMMGSPAPLALVELGPGRGTLMADALRAARAAPDFLAAMRLHLVELSPILREAQRQALEPLGIEPTWHDDISTVPPGPLLVIANEFFDALPVRQFQKSEDGWCERLVGLAPDGQGFRLVLGMPLGMPALVPEDLLDLPPGSLFEAHPVSEAVIFDLADHIARRGGAALIIDYGHTETAPGETLQAVKDHKFHTILDEPGCADLTTHVDFAALARVAQDAGARVFGPLVQGEFLDRLGLAHRAQTLLNAASPEQAKEISAAYRRLIDPDEMGTLFKVLALAHPELPQLPAFE